MFKERFIKISQSGKTSAFRRVKWERSDISGAFIISYFDCNVIFLLYIDIYILSMSLIIFNNNVFNSIHCL